MKKTFALMPILASVLLASNLHASNLRIIGGDKVSLEQYPYTAGLIGRGQSAEQAFCGGSVINSKWILTAAHCVIDTSANSLDVLTGTSVLSEADQGAGQRIEAVRIVIHPEYNDDYLKNDLALIELRSPTSAPAVRFATPAGRSRRATTPPSPL